MTVVWKPGKRMYLADHLSRMPTTNSPQESNWTNNDECEEDIIAIDMTQDLALSE